MDGLKWIMRYDIEADVSRFLKQHSRALKIFFSLLAINLFIFGQKLFFYSLPSDDYMRFWGDDNTQMLITNSARWAQALLNDHVFAGKLQILPYLNGFVGIVCITMMGYLSARFLYREKTVEIILTALLISATAMFAHNLYFSTNITTWITLLLGLVGFFKLYQPSYTAKVWGVILLVFSIGNYQSIIQIVALLAIFRLLLMMINTVEIKSVWKILWQVIWVMGMVFVAYIISYEINVYFLHHYQLHATHRLAQADSSMHINVWLERLKHVYMTKIDFVFFAKPLYILYGLIMVFSSLSVLATLITQKQASFTKRLFLVGIFISTLLFIPPIVNLPLLLGVDIPLRAYFPLGWAAGGFFVLLLVTGKGLFKSMGIVFAVALIIVQSYYISRFFDGCVRQTDADIRRANTIVERIRQSDEYKKEPIGFYILGQKKFNVKGWRMQWQQPFNSFWAKYKIFTYFTDLKFHTLSHKELDVLTHYIVTHYSEVQDYPGKNSVIVYRNMAILLLSSDKINILIQKEKNLKTIPLSRKPDIHSDFDLYVENNILYYYKKQCTQKDIGRKFFLRIYPKDPQHAMVDGRHIYDHQTWDFKFDLFGKRKDGSCIAAVPLPKTYKVGKIRTGQFGKNQKLIWEVVYRFEE